MLFTFCSCVHVIIQKKKKLGCLFYFWISTTTTIFLKRSSISFLVFSYRLIQRKELKVSNILLHTLKFVLAWFMYEKLFNFEKVLCLNFSFLRLFLQRMLVQMQFPLSKLILSYHNWYAVLKTSIKKNVLQCLCTF